MAVDEIPEGMRKCPFCAEIIRREAIICRFCQRDLPVPSDTDEPPAKVQAAEDRELRYGDRVLSATMGEGTVVGTRPNKQIVFVSFDRDHIQKKVGLSSLQLLPKVRAVAAPTAPRPEDPLIVVAWITAFFSR